VLRLRDWVAEFLGRIDPQLNRLAGMGCSGIICSAVSQAALKLGNFRDVRLVFGAPVDDDLVLVHWTSPLSLLHTWQAAEKIVMLFSTRKSDPRNHTKRHEIEAS